MWTPYLDWLARQSPAAAALLNPPATEQAIADLEHLVGHALPEPVKAGWRVHDGQDCASGPGVVCGFWWLPVAKVAAAWTEWAQVRADEDAEFFRTVDVEQRSYPRKAIQRRYTVAGWVPLFGAPFAADYVGLDFAPGPDGVSGQVINFGRDQEEKFVAAPDAAGLLTWLGQEATAGRIKADGEHVRHDHGTLLYALRAAAGASFP